MLLTLKIKLVPNQSQYGKLLDTVKEFNKACDYISEYAFHNKTSSVIKIHHGTYYAVKERFRISPRLIVRAIGKVAETYKLDKHCLHKFKEYSAVVYDRPILKFKSSTL
jgi:putative transposase